MSLDSLRILLVIESCGGGSARHVADLAGGLSSAGHHLEIAYSPLRADNWFIEELRALDGVQLHAINMHRNPGPQDFQAARELRALLNSQQSFDIIHGHSAKAGALVRLAGVGTAAAKVYTPHAFITLDPELSSKKRLIYTVAEKLLAGLADGIICVSNEEREHAIDLGIDPAILFTVENGLAPLPAPDRSAARSQLELLPDQVCLGFVGRLSGQKPVSRLVKAFHLLYLQYPKLVTVIVGEGPDFDAVRRLAASMNITDRVHFTGAADGKFLMAAFDVFVLPSSYEAFPYVYLEALARGLPIVSTDVGGSTAVIDEGENGYIVPQATLGQMVVRLALLAEDPQLRASMSQKSLEKSRHFTVSNMVEQTVVIYRQLLDRKKAAAGSQ
jgi:glycosyltransferase involved in cell wall biosynthesis